MSKKWISSDLHFGHKKILNFCPISRPFSSVDEMNENIINNFNELISPKDELYLLGDIAFCNVSKAVEYLKRLNGKKYLIIGNHDTHLLKKDEFRNQFVWCKDYYELKHNGNFICMSHYPILHWNRQHYGSMNFYGHLHARPSLMTGRSKDVGVDTNFCKPYLLDSLLSELSMIQFSESREELENYFKAS